MSATQPVLEVGLEPKAQPLLPATQSHDPALVMIERFAADPNFDVTKLQALMDMRERELNRVAEQEFNAAFARMQPKIPTIGEKSKTDKGTYAPREDIVDAIRPILADFGFSLSFRTEWPEPTRICIVGILTHQGGHSRESKFLTAADQSGSKNAIQALGSAVEYGRRYTTTDLLNIATRKADDDGKKSSAPPSPEGYETWLAHMETLIEKGATSDELNAAWANTDEPFRTYITKNDRARYEGWKKTAKAVKRA